MVREGEAEGRGVGAERVVGCDRLGHEIGPLGLGPRVHMVAPVAVGPAIEGAVLDGGQIVRRQVVADLVALVDDRPEHAALGLEGHADGIAQAGREEPFPAGREIHPPDRGATFLLVDAVLADIAVRADRGIERPALGIGDDVLGPVVVQGAGRKIGQGLALRLDPGLPVLVGKAHDAVRVGDVERALDQRHAEGRMEPVEEDRPRLGRAVAIRVAQEGDPVGARHAGAGPAHDQPHHEAPDPAALVRPPRGIGLGDQHVAVGQDIEPARMVEAVGEELRREPRGGGRALAGPPAVGWCNVDGRQQGPLRCRQLGIWAEAGWHRAVEVLRREAAAPIGASPGAAGEEAEEKQRRQSRRCLHGHVPSSVRLPPRRRAGAGQCNLLPASKLLVGAAHSSAGAAKACPARPDAPSGEGA